MQGRRSSPVCARLREPHGWRIASAGLVAALSLTLACAGNERGDCPGEPSDLCEGSWTDIVWHHSIDQAIALRGAEGELVLSVRGDPAQLTILRAETASELPLPSFATAIAAVDVDGDAVDELAVAFADPPEIVLYDLRDEPTLERRTTIPYDAAPRDLVAADLDGDGADELLSADGDRGTISVLSALDGDGERRPYAAGEAPFRLLVADLSGDGALDVAALDFVSGDLLVLHGDGAGGLVAAPSRPLTPGADRISAGDIDGDGRVDLGIVGGLGAEASVLLGEGGGAFSEPFTIDVDAVEGPLVMVEPGTRGRGGVGYVTDDELLTALVDSEGELEGGRARIRLLPSEGLLSLADGSYVSLSVIGHTRIRSVEGPVPIERARYEISADGLPPWQPSGSALAASDVDGDGDVDIVAARDALWTLLGDGAGSFVVSAPIASDRLDAMVLGDVDGDGDDDVVGRRGAELVVALGAGDGTFAFVDGGAPITEEAAIHMLHRTGGSQVVAFLGASGIQEASLEVFEFVDGGPLVPSPLPSLALVEPTRAATGDVDGDGDDDLLLLGRDGPEPDAPWAVQLVLTDAEGLTAGPTHRLEGLSALTSPLGLAVAEAVDDGPAEALVLSPSGVHRLIDPAAPTPAQALDPVALPGAARVTVAEVDGDGRRDLVLLGSNNRLGLVYAGPEGYAPSAPFRHQLPAVQALADVNSDGRVDFIGVEDGDVAVLINETHASPQIVDELGSLSRTIPKMSADLDGDGTRELIFGALTSLSVAFEPLSGAPQVHSRRDRIALLDAADVDGDGAAELLVRSYDNARELWTLRWDGRRLVRDEATWATALFTDAGPGWLALRDLDADSQLDLAAVAGERLVVAYGAPASGGAPTFTAPEVITEGVRGPLRIGDANGDGLAEILVSVAPPSVDVEAQRVAIADGRSWTVREFAGADAVIPAEGDLIVLRAQTLYHQPLRGDQLASPTKLAEVASPYVQLAGVGDVDGDGRSDILTADSQGRTLWIRRGDALVEERGVTLQVFPALLDIDGDGVAEILRDRGDRWAAYSPAEGTP